jgi:hypothetical protein
VVDEYLADPTFAYEGEIRARIVVVRDQMDAIRAEVDTPPGVYDADLGH